MAGAQPAAAGAGSLGMRARLVSVGDMRKPLQESSSPFPASTRKRKRVSETSEEPRSDAATQAPRSSRRETGEGHAPKLVAKLLTSTLHVNTPAQPTIRKSSVPIIYEEGASRRHSSDRQRGSFRRLHVCLLDDGQRGTASCIRRHEAGYPIPSWTTIPSLSCCYRPSRTDYGYACTP